MYSEVTIFFRDPPVVRSPTGRHCRMKSIRTTQKHVDRQASGKSCTKLRFFYATEPNVSVVKSIKKIILIPLVSSFGTSMLIMGSRSDHAAGDWLYRYTCLRRGGKKYICGYQQFVLVMLTDCLFTHYGNYVYFSCDEKLPELTNSLRNCSVICNAIFFLLALVL